MFAELRDAGRAIVHAVTEDYRSTEEARCGGVDTPSNCRGINFWSTAARRGRDPRCSQEEHLRAWDPIEEEAKGKVPVLAGRGWLQTR